MRRRQQTGDAEKTTDRGCSDVVEAAGHKDVGGEEMMQRWQDGGLGRRRDGRMGRFKEVGIIGVLYLKLKSQCFLKRSSV